MKLTAFFMLVTVMQISAKGYSQTVTISAQNASLQKVFRSIQKQTGYNFLCTIEQLSATRKVDLTVKNAPLKEVLDLCFENQPLTYMIVNKTIIVKRKKPAKNEEQPPSSPPPIHIAGTITDAVTGNPLTGVTIQVKGNTMGTTTDANGKFSLDAPEDAVLVVSYIGYGTKEIAINGRETVNISLIASNTGLNQLIVVGYGTQKKGDLTGSVGSIKSDQLNIGVHANVDQMLAGKVAGVHVTQSSAGPGGMSSIRIRGATSITASNEPLYVIDGLPGAPLNALNPRDIESIEVLKDASAAAIYGSRGANGVILITTRKGHSGKVVIGYNGSYGIQQVAKKLPLMNGRQYMGFINDLSKDRGETPVFTPEQISAIGSGTDWQDAILRVAPVQNHEISLSGGSDNTQFYIALNNLNQEGIVINTGIKRYGARVNISHSAGRFNFGLNLNTSLVKDQDVPSGNFNQGAGVIATAIMMDPVLKIRNSDGTYVLSTMLDLNNPVAQANTIYTNTETNRTFGNIFAEYSILDNLKAKVNFGNNRSIGRRDNYVSTVTKRGQISNGQADVSVNENSTYLIELTLHYKKEFKKGHQVDAVAGYTYQQFNDRSVGANAQDFPTDAFRTDNLAAGNQEKNTVVSGRSKNQLLSYLGRVNYVFRNKYLATASFRVDGSSRFGTDNKYGYFPALALGWRLSEESFISDLDLFSNLKLRASYGVNGNQEIGNYNSLVLLGSVGNAVFDQARYNSIAPVKLGNPDLKWETTTQTNVGLDFGFLRGRITGSMDYFVKKTSDLLLNLPIPSTSGFTNSLQNVGDTRNNGFEFLINSQNLTGKFSWSTGLNFSTIHNEVTNLGDLPFILQGDFRFLSNFSILKEGTPINAYYGYKVDGVFQSQEEIDKSAQPGARAGDLKFKDVNNDGKINADDRTILGDPFPNLTFGFYNDFSYMGFNLSVFFEGNYGQQQLNFTKVESESPVEFLRNRQAYVLNRWTPDNPTNDNPSFVSYDASKATNSRVVEDASFVRLKDVRLSYGFPGLHLKGITALSVYVTLQNLITITNYSGYNPDVSSLGNSNLRVDYDAYPLAKMYTAGINVQF